MTKYKLFPHEANILWVSPQRSTLARSLVCYPNVPDTSGAGLETRNGGPSSTLSPYCDKSNGMREGSGSSVGMDINYNFVG